MIAPALAGLLGGLLAVAAATSARGLPAQQPRFQRVLWVPAAGASEPARLQRIAAAGFDAIQLSPGTDPAPARAAGLGYYLDQPIGKGFLELRDEQFEPLRAEYERTRDPRALVRPQCLRDPGLLTELGARAAAAAAAAAGPGLRFVALADEASATRHNNPLDLCRCTTCLLAFRAFAQQRYTTVEALNKAWGTEFAAFDQVEPLTTDQVRRRELGGVLLPANLRPYGDWLEFVDIGFAAAVAHLREQVQRELRDVPVGLTGLQAPTAFGGHDYARLLPGTTLVEPYDVGGALRLCRSLQPQAQLWSTLTLPVADDPEFERLTTARLCELAALGASGVVVWNETAAFGADGACKPATTALQRAFATMQPVLDECAGAMPVADPVWIVESQASVRAWWMLDSAGDGLTWVRRFASHEAAHSTSFAARSGAVTLLADLGIHARFVAERELPERLLQERPRLLVLPATIAMADRVCRAVHAFVQQGGVVVADHATALYDETLALRGSGGLDDLFGITARSLRWDGLGVREGRPVEPSTQVAEAALRAHVAERHGDTAVFAEAHVGRGRAVYLNLLLCDYPRLRLLPSAVDAAVDLRRRMRQVLQSAEVAPVCDVRGEGLPTCIDRTVLRTRGGRTLLALRVAALDAPGMLQKLAHDGRRAIKLSFARPVHLLEFAGQDLGSRSAFDLQLDAYAGLFVELQK